MGGNTEKEKVCVRVCDSRRRYDERKQEEKKDFFLESVDIICLHLYIERIGNKNSEIDFI